MQSGRFGTVARRLARQHRGVVLATSPHHHNSAFIKKNVPLWWVCKRCVKEAKLNKKVQIAPQLLSKSSSSSVPNTPTGVPNYGPVTDTQITATQCHLLSYPLTHSLIQQQSHHHSYKTLYTTPNKNPFPPGLCPVG